MLSYLARIDDRATRPLIEERLMKSGEKSGFNVFFNLSVAGPLTKEVEKLLAVRLESDEEQVAGTAAYYLSRNPSEENRKLIRKRYTRWLKECGSCGAEIENPSLRLRCRAKRAFKPSCSAFYSAQKNGS